MKPTPSPQPKPAPKWRVRIRPRFDPVRGHAGQWVTWSFQSEGERLFFITLWEHDFEMELPRSR